MRVMTDWSEKDADRAPRSYFDDPREANKVISCGPPDADRNRDDTKPHRDESHRGKDRDVFGLGRSPSPDKGERKESETEVFEKSSQEELDARQMRGWTHSDVGDNDNNQTNKDYDYEESSINELKISIYEVDTKRNKSDNQENKYANAQDGTKNNVAVDNVKAVDNKEIRDSRRSKKDTQTTKTDRSGEKYSNGVKSGKVHGPNPGYGETVSKRKEEAERNKNNDKAKENNDRHRHSKSDNKKHSGERHQRSGRNHHHRGEDKQRVGSRDTIKNNHKRDKEGETHRTSKRETRNYLNKSRSRSRSLDRGIRSYRRD